ncbi:MAG TPA: HAMP domain-containing sensor histidine kinase [Methanomassiliicoccales archaeon]|jgi:signal transduction histidine kinase
MHRRQRSLSIKAELGQTRLDVYLEDEPSYSETIAKERSDEREWRTTIGTMLRHDLLNKLTVAQGGLELFDRSSDSKFLDITKRNLEACGEIVGRISTLEKAIDTTALTPLDVGSIARNVMANHQGLGICLEVHGRGIVMADAALHNVLDNLVSNAIKHATPSKICIDIEKTGDLVLIKVSDDGIGIPEEARASLFQEGFKFGPKGNTGLGLFIVSRLVQKYGGRIWLDENISAGAVFCIELANGDF